MLTNEDLRNAIHDVIDPLRNDITALRTDVCNLKMDVNEIKVTKKIITWVVAVAMTLAAGGGIKGMKDLITSAEVPAAAAQ